MLHMLEETGKRPPQKNVSFKHFFSPSGRIPPKLLTKQDGGYLPPSFVDVFHSSPLFHSLTYPLPLHKPFKTDPKRRYYMAPPPGHNTEDDAVSKMYETFREKAFPFL
jgi:hypothetical protein